MKQRRIILIILAIVIALVVGFVLIQPKEISELVGLQQTEKGDYIRLIDPKPQQVISSPLKITGEARGNWFFEANFPVVLTNWDGLIIAEGYATADGEWMAEDFVPFTAELTFEKPDLYPRGSLILQKANASGLPEHDDALEITINFWEE